MRQKNYRVRHKSITVRQKNNVRTLTRQLVCPADFSCTWKENGAHGKKMTYSGEIMNENTLTRGFFAVPGKITENVSGQRAFVLSFCTELCKVPLLTLSLTIDPTLILLLTLTLTLTLTPTLTLTLTLTLTRTRNPNPMYQHATDAYKKETCTTTTTR